jgi:hypothetical protein
MCCAPCTRTIPQIGVSFSRDNPSRRRPAFSSHLKSSVDHRHLDRRQLLGLVRCLPNGNFRVDGDSTRLLNLPARKPVVGGNRQYLRGGRMRGFVCASLLGLAATLAEGAPVMLGASLPGHVELW